MLSSFSKCPQLSVYLLWFTLKTCYINNLHLVKPSFIFLLPSLRSCHSNAHRSNSVMLTNVDICSENKQYDLEGSPSNSQKHGRLQEERDVNVHVQGRHHRSPPSHLCIVPGCRLLPGQICLPSIYLILNEKFSLNFARAVTRSNVTTGVPTQYSSSCISRQKPGKCQDKIYFRH